MTDPDGPGDVLGDALDRQIPVSGKTAQGISVVVSCPDWLVALPEAAELAHEAATAALAAAGFAPLAAQLELGIWLGGDDDVQRLNRLHRNRDAPTNVLAFAVADCVAGTPPEPPALGAPLALGDVVLGCATVSAEAQDQNKPLADHLRHLVVHGVLHIAGHDHQIEAQARTMEAMERAVLERLGVADPYGEGKAALGLDCARPQLHGRP